jgi:hypothetical protein
MMPPGPAVGAEIPPARLERSDEVLADAQGPGDPGLSRRSAASSLHGWKMFASTAAQNTGMRKSRRSAKNAIVVRATRVTNETFWLTVPRMSLRASGQRVNRNATTTRPILAQRWEFL